MDQKESDDFKSEENEENSFRDSESETEDFLEDAETEGLEAEPLDDDEPEASSEEKVNDVNDILDNNDDNDNDNNDNDDNDDNLDNNKVDKTPKKTSKEEWESDDDNKKTSRSTWKYISGILLVLLVAAVYTNGFNFTGASTVSTLTLIDAEDKVLDYVNNNLLQPPYTAAVKSSEELDNLFKITLSVAGQEINSYLTKDGKFFFPQGFDLETPLELGPLESPETKLIEVSIEGDPVLGSENAPVTIVEFSDFQCLFCKKGWETIKQVVEEYEYVKSGKVKIAFRDFPLGFHSQAKPAAMAAECAHEQGKFWEYHDLLFENQDTLNPENFKKWAVDLGLDVQQFDACLNSEKYRAEVEKDFADGQSYGVSGTPAFFVNGKLISGAQPLTVFRQAIEEALKESEEGPQETELPSESGESLEESESPLEGQVGEVAEVLEETEEPVEITATPPEPAVKEIQITAKKWRFDPAYIEVNQGDQIRLTLTSEELDVKFILSAFGVSKEVAAGEPVVVEFTADKKGTFNFLCGDYCVSKYGAVQGAALKGEVVVS